MKRIVPIFLLLLLLAVGCKARTGSGGSQPPVPESSVETEAPAQREEPSAPSSSVPPVPPEESAPEVSEAESVAEVSQEQAPLPVSVTLREDGDEGALREATFRDEARIQKITQLLAGKKKLPAEQIHKRENATTLVAFSEEKDGSTGALMVYPGTPVSMGEEVTIVANEGGLYYTSAGVFDTLLDMLDDA